MQSLSKIEQKHRKINRSGKYMIGIFQIDFSNKNDNKYIYHFYGHYGVGKTALARHLCKFALENNIVPIFIDTHGALFHDQIVKDGIDSSAIIYIPPIDAMSTKIPDAINKVCNENCIIIIDNIATIGQRGKTLIEKLRCHIFDNNKLKANVVIFNNIRVTLAKDVNDREMWNYSPYGWDFLHSFCDITFKMSRSRTSNDRSDIRDKIECKVVSSKVDFIREDDIVTFFITNGTYDDYRTCVVGALDQGLAWKVGENFIVDDMVFKTPEAIYNAMRKLVKYS